MRKKITILFYFISILSYSQTAITDANFKTAINTCLSTNPVDGLCSSSEYGAMPNWDVGNVTNMINAFLEKTDFNADISAWDVSNVIFMTAMFGKAPAFNQDIGGWNVSKVTRMHYMFWFASSFNQDIGSWDVSKTRSMRSMFYNATSFNKDIGTWDVSRVRNMFFMFGSASSFNQDIGAWDVRGCGDMYGMFSFAISFNQDISAWAISSVNRITSMFYNATSFNQDISAWDVSNVTDLQGFFTRSGLSTKNYDAILTGWSNLTLQQNATFGAEETNYCLSETARQRIIDTFGWTINDAGLDCTTRLPLITTSAATTIGNTAATLGGIIAENGGDVITERGIVYAITTINATPLIGATGVTKDENGLGIGTFFKSITGLASTTEYSYKAYATNVAGTSYGAVFTFTTKIPTPPIIIDLSPTDNATGVSIDTDLVLTFNENIVKDTGTIKLYDAADDTVVASIDITSDQVSIAGAEVTVNLINNLEKSKKYYVLISATAIKDNEGTYFAGIADKTTFNFDTEVKVAATLTFADFTKVYGDLDTILGATSNATGTISYSIVAGGTGSGSVSGTNNEIFSIGVAGTVKIKATQIEDANFLSTEKEITVTIIKASLTITADANKTKIYGTADPILTYTIAGFVNADTEADLDTPVSISRVGGEAVGIYTISPSEATNANYEISFISNPFEITRANITFIVAIDDKEYDGTTVASISLARLVGVIAGDEVRIDELPNAVNFLTANAGTAIAVTYTGSFLITGTDAANYTTLQPTDLSADILTKEITISGITGNNKVFDGTTAASVSGLPALNGLILGDDVVLASSITYTFASSNPGINISISFTDEILSGADLGNYRLLTPSLFADITSAIPTIKSYAFSPNNDGINDAWLIGGEGILLYPNNVVQVFNRSGKLVFKKKAYQSDWDGISNQISSRSKLPVGSYLFIIDLGDDTAPVRGWLYINY